MVVVRAIEMKYYVFTLIEKKRRKILRGTREKGNLAVPTSPTLRTRERQEIGLKIFREKHARYKVVKS